ncbi:thioester reductase domain-containing protein [Streptomyces microflavus]|uniref:thioester reductase domain-containing protein n=1 Tax=Streptomyces microflavus TaxID=1919 RepID=UPI0033D40098
MSAGPVLLTGATGFLGGQLCAELLDRTRSPIICLVRPTTGDPAARLRRRMTELDYQHHCPGRVVALPGDIERPRLGLSGADYQKLARSLEAVYHCAASVNLAASYEEAAAPNLRGTTELIRLAERGTALTGRAPRFHHVSTLGTFHRAGAAGLAEADESTVATADLIGPFGYGLSKAEAETEVLAAASRGLPVTIHRPGVITGHHASGRSGHSDTAVALMRAMLALRVAPRLTTTLYLDTVDTVAGGIVELSRTPASFGQVFHHVRPAPVPIADLVAALRRAGHRLPLLPGRLWWRRVDDHAADPAVTPAAVAGTLGGPALTEDGSSGMPLIRSDRTWAALRAAGVGAPPLDAAFLHRLIAQSLPRTEQER